MQACGLSEQLQHCTEEERRAVCDFGFDVMQQVTHPALHTDQSLPSCTPLPADMDR